MFWKNVCQYAAGLDRPLHAQIAEDPIQYDYKTLNPTLWVMGLDPQPQPPFDVPFSFPTNAPLW